jgi:hypothetical protein
MTDRELLEIAARAAGYCVKWKDAYDAGFLDQDLRILPEERQHFIFASFPFKEWNPLADDGDALRMAVKLGIDIVVSVARPARSAACPPDQIGPEHYLEEDHNGDPYAATRRAIVRAAAEIGKAMK